MKQTELIESYADQVKRCKATAHRHLQFSTLELNYRPKEGSWNVLECYEHMNRFGKLYLQFFENALAKAQPSKKDANHKSGWLGAWSIRSMDTKEMGVRAPMKTFKKMDPLSTDLEETVIQQFIKQQDGILQVLRQADGLDIDKVKCQTTIKMLKFKLSDALGFTINHNIRHQVQADRALLSIQS